MDKRGSTGEELSLATYIEVVLGILVAVIFITAASNPDSFSNINIFYAEEDITLLTETMTAAPGYIEYDYEIKSLYTVSITDEVSVTKSSDASFTDGYNTYTLHFEKDQGEESVSVTKVA